MSIRKQNQANGTHRTPLAKDLGTIQLNCNNLENELAEGLQTIDNKQIHLQNLINELENAFTNATQVTQQRTNFDGERTFIELHEKVRITASNWLDDEIDPCLASSQVMQLEQKLHTIQRNVFRCASCQLVCSKMNVLREKVATLLIERRDQIQELADTKY